MQVASEYLKYCPNQGYCSAKLLIGEGGLTLYTTLVLVIIKSLNPASCAGMRK